MTFGDVMYWVLVGFVFVWAADVLHTWDALDRIFERRFGRFPGLRILRRRS